MSTKQQKAKNIVLGISGVAALGGIVAQKAISDLKKQETGIGINPAGRIFIGLAAAAIISIASMLILGNMQIEDDNE
jgi:hypothetical protein